MSLVSVIIPAYNGAETIERTIVGVVKDFHTYSLQHKVEPMVLLKMTCPSTAHIHILRVPLEMMSAETAITWINHGIHPDRFDVQT